jgi:hypothetical protein
LLGGLSGFSNEDIHAELAEYYHDEILRDVSLEKYYTLFKPGRSGGKAEVLLRYVTVLRRYNLSTLTALQNSYF